MHGSETKEAVYYTAHEHGSLVTEHTSSKEKSRQSVYIRMVEEMAEAAYNAYGASVNQ